MHNLNIILLSVSCLVGSTIVTAMPTHSLTDIRDTATNYVRANFTGDENDIRITAKKLDPRLKLALCKQKLQAHMPYSNLTSSHTIVGVRCEGEQPWSLHVSVSIQIYRDVAVASRSLAQGNLLTADDIDMQHMDISQLSGGYLAEANAAIGQVTTRPVQLGRPLLSNMLKAPTVIRRGQAITVLARKASFEVSSMGESLMDGAVGERIKVRVRRSRRIIEGIIAKNGVVFVD